ncbi:hypothetical protein VT930_11805 [Mycobacterium sherrisii]|uniref:hypothetical protein n=1 Tax=Mycobacterium sherrisii TaxID=243061 RepID=UPI002DDD9AD1|nr:hypothetical protein [Mycobacterium sherrisii]MEC4763788.1 hypothetical protein [Mycobacterium sherrisii]
MSDKFWAWFDSFAEPYEPLMATLSERFGATFVMVHTGGGCMAIEATLEGCGLMITDTADILSSWDERQEAAQSGEPLGYAVGVYPLETYEQDGKQFTEVNTSEAVGWASSPRADGADRLIRLIELAIARVGQPINYEHVPDAELGVK